MTNVKGIFITGTDTDAGKSVISAGILYTLRQHFHLNALPVKPLQTGVEVDANQHRHIPDLDYSLQVCHMTISDEKRKQLAPCCFQPACSPHLAAEIAHTTINTDLITQQIHALESEGDLLVVEGAGGLYVPINQEETNLELIKKVNYPVVVVVRNGLGCINHALLTIKVLQQHQVPVLGFICNNLQASTPENAYIQEDNPKSIAHFSQVPYLGEVKNLQKNSQGIVAWETAHLDCSGLFDQILS